MCRCQLTPKQKYPQLPLKSSVVSNNNEKKQIYNAHIVMNHDSELMMSHRKMTDCTTPTNRQQ